MRTYIQYKDKIVSVIKWWLVGILLLMPFQHWLVGYLFKSNGSLSSLISSIDDITILILLPFAVWSLYKKKMIFKWLSLLLIMPILVLLVCGLISGMLNGNSLLITVHGTYDYLRSFLVIIVYAALFKDISEFGNVFRFLLITAFLICGIAIIQESWAMVSRYILGMSDGDARMYILSGKAEGNWRFGIYRASSILAHYNILGLYSLFMLTMYLFPARKINFAVFVLLAAGVFISLSRMLYLGFVLLMAIQIYKKKRWLTLFLLPVLVVMLFMSSLDDLEITSAFVQDSHNEEYDGINSASYGDDGIPYRKFARDKAMEVWMDHPIWGVGPGMFGGAIAIKYISPIYDEYNFLYIMSWFKSLDQFWPQILAEMGIAGLGAFSGLFLSLLGIMLLSIKWSVLQEIKDLFSGLASFMIILFIYTFGSNLNIISVLFPYCAFIGMGLGINFALLDKRGKKYASYSNDDKLIATGSP